MQIAVSVPLSLSVSVFGICLFSPTAAYPPFRSSLPVPLAFKLTPPFPLACAVQNSRYLFGTTHLAQPTPIQPLKDQSFHTFMSPWKFSLLRVLTISLTVLLFRTTSVLSPLGLASLECHISCFSECGLELCSSQCMSAGKNGPEWRLGVNPNGQAGVGKYYERLRGGQPRC